MSSNSNLGYGNINQFNSNYVNTGSINDPSGFGNKVIPGCPGVAGSQSNVDAAAGIVPGFAGGSIKKKIKNITRKYKMRLSKRKMNSLKKRIRQRYARRSFARSRKMYGGARRKHSRRRQRGGYSQYQNNQPITNTYSVGGVVGANESALANGFMKSLPTCTNCIDNYNHYTGSGTPSAGH
jgi:hypothetical protein